MVLTPKKEPVEMLLEVIDKGASCRFTEGKSIIECDFGLASSFEDVDFVTPISHYGVLVGCHCDGLCLKTHRCITLHVKGHAMLPCACLNVRYFPHCGCEKRLSLKDGVTKWKIQLFYTGEYQIAFTRIDKWTLKTNVICDSE